MERFTIVSSLVMTSNWEKVVEPAGRNVGEAHSRPNCIGTEPPPVNILNFISGVHKIKFSMFTGGGSVPIQFGRLWASPTLRPAGSTTFSQFEVMTKDDTIVNRSIGQQTYVDYKGRFRQLK